MTRPKTPRRIKIAHGVDPSYLENVLTKDITALESIFELIDNSVDAARDQILSNSPTTLDKFGLPESYEGYRISIRLRNNSLVFADNCSGIPKDILASRAFVIGAMSNHTFGIGRFGIGLKRALFRLGTRYRLYTDTGAFRATMSFRDVHLKGTAPELFASERASINATGTIIRISELRDRVKYEFSGEEWKATLPKILSKRYGRYIGKGLEIFLNTTPIEPFGPGFRSFMSIKPSSHSVMAPNGVTIFVDTGMHEQYRVKGEDDYSKTSVGALTDEFGWYFVCNDRIVEIATHTASLGWKTRWHQEYYGFVGWVYFVAEDAEHLPWDTKKTTIDPHSLAFREIADQLQSFAEDYKQKNKHAKTSTKISPAISALAGASAATSSITPQHPPNRPAAVSPQPNNSKIDGKGGSHGGPNVHNEYWTTLVPDLNIVIENKKLASLLNESNRLSINFCYAGTLLYRSLMEIALFEHLKKTKSLGLVKEMYYLEQEKNGRSFDIDKKKKFRPDFRTALDWLNKNDEYFPEDVRRDCTFARNKFNKHLPEMNGLTHENDLTNSSKLATIRDDTLVLLRFLLTEV